MADQFRGDAFGFRGKEVVKTPNFDSFSKEAVVFTQAVSGYPVSSPARGMFLSGAIRIRMELLPTASQNLPLRMLNYEKI